MQFSEFLRCVTFRRRRKPAAPTLSDPPPRKWLPVIDTDSCGGCGRCVEVCEPDCIELVWAFATVRRPDDCASCGACAEICPHEVIEMDWVEFEGDDRAGRIENPTAGDDPLPRREVHARRCAGERHDFA